MNKNTYIFRIGIFLALLICSGVFLFSTNALAIWDLINNDLIQTGKANYEAGRYEDAIEEFSKVLLNDPRNEEALSYLHKMGLEGGIYGARNNAVDKLFQLNQEILAYQKELKSLQSDKKAQEQHNVQLKQKLQDTIVQKKAEKDQLINANQELRAVATMKIKEQQDYISQLEKVKDDQRQDLVRLNTDFSQAKEQLNQDESAITEKAQALTDLQNNYDKDKQVSEEELKGLRIAYNEKLAGLEKDRNDLEKEVFDAKDDHREKMKEYQKALTDTQTQLKLEKNLSTIKSYRIAQQDNRYLTLKKQLDGLRKERKLLYDEATDLKSQIRELRQDKTFRMATQTETQPPQKDLVEHVNKQDDEIVDLKTRLSVLLDEVDSLRKEQSAQSKDRVLELEGQMEKLKKGIESKEKDLEFAKDQQGILKDRIDEYQDRLDTVEGMIKDKEERILFLEKQLGDEAYPEKEESR